MAICGIVRLYREIKENNMILNNGIKVLFYPMTNTHSVTMGLYIKAGQLYGEKKTGITHFLEHLHFRQAGDLTQDLLYYKMESLGSTLSATTYRDFLKFTMKITPNHIAECLDIFSNLVVVSEWREDSFQKEKRVIINQIAEQGFYAQVQQSIRKVIFKDHPLSQSIMGTIEQVDDIALEDVIEYKLSIMNSEDLLFCVTGNFSSDDKIRIAKTVEKWDISSKVNDCRYSVPSCFSRRKPDIMLLYNSDDEYIDVNLSFDIVFKKGERDWIKLLNCIIGEGVGSRLQKQIREKKAYSSNIYSYLEWYHSFAVMHIVFSVEKSLLLECFGEIVRELKSVKNCITKEDLDVTLPFYTTNCAFVEDDTEEMNFQLAYNYLVFNEEFQPMDIKSNEDSIGEIRRIAQKYLLCKNMCVTLSGDTKKITKKSIKDFADLLE